MKTTPGNSDAARLDWLFKFAQLPDTIVVMWSRQTGWFSIASRAEIDDAIVRTVNKETPDNKTGEVGAL